MINIEEVSKYFKKSPWSPNHFALKNVSLFLEEGKIYGLVGSNGAGKSTLLKTILGLIKPTEGRIIISPSLQKNQVSYLPENPTYHSFLTGKEFLRYRGSLYGLTNELIEKYSDYWATKLGLKNWLDKRIQAYSKGMAQKVGLISCLIVNPKFLIMDEPFSGLDPISREILKQILLDLNQTHKMGVIFSDHSLKEIEELSHKVILLNSGKLRYFGRWEDLVKRNGQRRTIKIKFSNRGDRLDIKKYNGKNLLVSDDSVELVEIPFEFKDHAIKEIYSLGGEIQQINERNLTVDQIYGREELE